MSIFAVRDVLGAANCPETTLGMRVVGIETREERRVVVAPSPIGDLESPSFADFLGDLRGELSKSVRDDIEPSSVQVLRVVPGLIKLFA